MNIVDLINSNPKLAIILIAAAVTLIMTIVTKYVTNQNRMKELKDIQKACNIKLKDARKKIYPLCNILWNMPLSKSSKPLMVFLLTWMFPY